MQVIVNGQAHEVAQDTTLSQLLSSMHIALDGTAVAVNDEIVPKSNFGNFKVNEAMRIDIFSLVAGG